MISHEHILLGPKLSAHTPPLCLWVDLDGALSSLSKYVMMRHEW